MVKTKWLKLPYSFDVEKMQLELKQIRSGEWINHMNTSAYKKRWCCIPLYSVDGRTDTIYAFEEDADYLPTKILERCPYIKSVIETFECEKAAVRLMSLAAGDEIAPHVDGYSSYDGGVLRIHVPIVTDPKVKFIVDGEEVHFTQGDTWYLNADCMHGVRNDWDRDRVHLLMDCRRDQWVEALFEKAGYVPDDPPKYGDPSITDDNVHEIIASLENSGFPAGLEHAAKLKKIAGV